MIAYGFLIAAILFECVGTISLRIASRGLRRWYAVVVTTYLIAFAFLSLALRDGLDIGVAYGIWAASGVALTAVASRVLFKEAVSRTTVLGIAIIVVGVLVVEIAASAAHSAA